MIQKDQPQNPDRQFEYLSWFHKLINMVLPCILDNQVIADKSSNQAGAPHLLAESKTK